MTNIVDENGDVIKGYTYTAFGNTTVTGSSAFINSTAYTGAVLDNLTGLYYMNARYYDASTGRFITMDSYVGNLAEPWPWHLYAYCEGDPVNKIDPSGHTPMQAVFAAIGGCVGWLLGDYVARQLGYAPDKGF